MKKIVLLISALIFLSTTYGKEPYNFVMFVVDDLGWADVSPNNPKTFYETPNIQKIADNGITFSQGYSSNPVCSPARYGIQTGKYPTRGKLTNFLVGVREGLYGTAKIKEYMDPSEITIAEMLKKVGYKTCFIGKWHLGKVKEYWPEHQGYDVNVGGHKAGASNYFAPFNNPYLKNVKKGEYLPEILSNAAVKFIDENKNDKFFMAYCFYLVHTPLQAKENMIKKYEEKAKAMGLSDEKSFEPIEQYWKNGEPRRVRSVQGHPSYAAMIEALDTAVGEVQGALKRNNIADKTVIFFVSDNGGLSTAEGSPTSNYPLKGGKGWTNEGGIRIPFIAMIPSVTKGTVSEEYVSSLDLFPTICELAGVKVDYKIDGVSILPLIKGDKNFKHPDLYWHYPHYSNQGGLPSGAVRSREWKLIESFENGDVQLYNIANDISEKNDLAKKYPEIVAELKKKLHSWYKETDAEFLPPRKDSPDQKPWRPIN